MIRRCTVPLFLIWLFSSALLAQIPLAHNDELVGVENIVFSIAESDLLANDDYQSFEPVVTLASGPQSGQLTVVAKGGFLFTPDPDFFGYDAFTYTVTTSQGTSVAATVRLWVAPRRTAFAGNWDGDPEGTDELAWLSHETGRLFLCNGSFEPLTCDPYSTTLETIGRDPLAMDWDGDGVDEVALFDSATGTFTLTEYAMAGAEGTLIFVADIVLPEAVGQRPVVGNWSCSPSGVDTVGLFEPATGRVRLRNTNTAGPFDYDFVLAVPTPGGLPATGAWEGACGDTVGVYHGATGEFYSRADNTPGPLDVLPIGSLNLTPLAGRWSAGAPAMAGVYDRIMHVADIFSILGHPRPVQVPEDPLDPG